jgi:uncharacterized protein YndB with AHSA1/START domain
MQKTVWVQNTIQAPLDKVWECWNKPEHIKGWAFASDDWEAPFAENDPRVGGKFKTRMQAKDGSLGFDFTGTYTAVKENELIEYTMDDGRRVRVDFSDSPEGVKITETFEPENENPEEVQCAGWQAILDNFKRYCENSF